MPLIRVLVILTCVFSPFTFAASNQQIVENFVSAFNQHDINTMLSLSAPDVHWMSVQSDNISVEAASHNELENAMTNYFSSIPNSRSELQQITSSGNFVQTTEQAFWSVNGEAEKSQCSIAIYELELGLIKRVWYYPSHPCNS